LGAGRDPGLPDRFPLLLKLLDSRDALSVQVHPDDAGAARLKEGELGKTEAWYILEADPGACIYRGVASGVDRAEFAARLREGTVGRCLKRLEVSPGEVYFLPAGTVHALGPGVRLAEIQQNSDTTFRLFDWNRVGLDGKPRELHVENGLRVARLDAPGRDRAEPEAVRQDGAARECFVADEKFVLERLHGFTYPAPMETDRASFHILTVVNGSVEIHAGGAVEAIGRWETCLVPAAAGEYTLAGDEDASVLLFRRP
jgi:mannose-6-phosphate isomerase